MRLRSIAEADIEKGTRVIVRVDFDVPIENNKILDDTRIRETLPTIQYLVEKGACILLLTKRGHFDVKRSPVMSTKILVPHLERLLKKRVYFIGGFSRLAQFLSSRRRGQIFLFENLRFWPEEEANSTSLQSTLQIPQTSISVIILGRPIVLTPPLWVFRDFFRLMPGFF